MTGACICDHPHADHQQTLAGPAECDLCDCPTFTADDDPEGPLP